MAFNIQEANISNNIRKSIELLETPKALSTIR